MEKTFSSNELVIHLVLQPNGNCIGDIKRKHTYISGKLTGYYQSITSSKMLISFIADWVPNSKTVIKVTAMSGQINCFDNKATMDIEYMNYYNDQINKEIITISGISVFEEIIHKVNTHKKLPISIN